MRSCELRIRVFKSSTDVGMSDLEVGLTLWSVGCNFKMLKAYVFLINPVGRPSFKFSP